MTRATVRGARRALGLAADAIVDNAPRIPVRDLATLRGQFPGLGPEELADKLVAGAVKGTSGVGAGVGAASMLPVPPAMPAELAGEVLGVAMIEIKLLAELHEVYGLRAPGSKAQRAYAYVSVWASDGGHTANRAKGVHTLLGSELAKQLRQQVLKRLIRNLPVLVPFLVGAAAGAYMNRRDTRRLAARVRADLRPRQIPWDSSAIPAQSAGRTESSALTSRWGDRVDR
ncbi:hypothetical protein [Streptomyces smaragdinus]|uniref:hypothetical protein n=1 Tax=Streptomyces smaragdinus TaxID=2585196 RepID=UPI0012967CC4|nr:hypothetical protein [Streptomyces smaragdinus]